MNNNYDRFSSCKTSPLIFYLRSSFCKVTIYHFLLSFSYTFHCWYLWFAKPWVSGCESMGFRVWKHGFQDVKPRVLQMRSINFENCKQTAVICLQIVRKRDDIMLTNVKYVDCINIHFRPHFCIFMQKCQGSFFMLLLRVSISLLLVSSSLFTPYYI